MCGPNGVETPHATSSDRDANRWDTPVSKSKVAMFKSEIKELDARATSQDE